MAHIFKRDHFPIAGGGRRELVGAAAMHHGKVAGAPERTLEWEARGFSLNLMAFRMCFLEP